MRSSSSRDGEEHAPVLELAHAHEAALLEHAHRRGIPRIDVGDDPRDAHRVEGVADARLRRLAGVAAAPAVATEAVRELPVAESRVEMDTRIADELAGV